MRRLRFLALGLAALLAGASAAVAQTTVVMWSFLDPARTSPREVALREMIQAFERANPTIRIRVEPQDFAQMPPRFFLGHRTGSNPDLVFIDAKNLGGLSQSGAAADLAPLVTSRWSAADQADIFVRAGLDAARQGNRVLALPLFHGASVIYYRKDLFRAAGIDPASITTWDALLDAARRLTRSREGRVETWGFGLPLSPEKTESTPLLIRLVEGQRPLFEGCRPRWANVTGVAALRYTADLITQARVAPREALTLNVDDITDQFAAGRYAMAISSSLRMSGIQRAATFDKDEIGILPWPSIEQGAAAPMPVSGWWIAAWARSPRLNEAARFVDFMQSREGARFWAVTGGQVPTRRSLLEDPFFRAPEQAWVGTMVSAWGRGSWMEPTECNTRTMQSILNEAVHRVVVQNTDPMAALTEAERRFTEEK